jgi:hypothetical protein
MIQNQYAESSYTESHFTGVIIQNVIMLIVAVKNSSRVLYQLLYRRCPKTCFNLQAEQDL